jgi:lipopolysaccharide transport system permease protein
MARLGSAPGDRVEEPPSALATKRHVRLEPSHGWVGLPFRRLWEYRELLYFLVWRDLKVRYKQTSIGAFWAVLQPLLLMAVFTVFLGRLAKLPSSGAPYALLTYTALVPWTMFSQALSQSSESLLKSTSLVEKVYFPRILLPLGAALSFVLDFLIAFCLLIVLMAIYGIHPTPRALLVPVFSVFAFFAALSVGIGLSALNVRYRDVRYAVPFLVQLLLFVSPIAYSTTVVPEGWRDVYALNPLVGVVEGFRWSLLHVGPAPGVMTAVSAAMTLALLVAGVVYFQRTERSFADVI